jgi:histidinol-phosphate aminotransferase
MQRSSTSTYDPGVQVSGENILCLHRNENLFVGRDWTVETAREIVADAAIAEYPEPTSLPLRQALAEVYGVGPENVFVGNGSDEVLSDLLGLLRGRFDTMGLLDVHFKIYDLLADRFGYRVRTIPGKTFQTGRIAADGWQGLAVVDSPNAITGNHLDWQDLRPLATADSFLIWDNAYGEFAGDQLPPDLPANVVMVRSFSKFFALAGLRVGYCIAEPDLIGDLLAAKDAFNVNGFAQRMALAALDQRDRFSQLAQEILVCREELATRLLAMNFEVREPGGNYLFVTHPDFTAERLQQELLTRRIAVRRFAERPTANYVRITVPPWDGVEELMAALEEIFEQDQVGADRDKIRDVV